ncbi:MAG TPA: hypothetical protein VIK73_07700 [Limnochordales bacterium]
MGTALLYGAAVGVLLLSNIWMLRELDALKRQLDAYQREVASLDDRVCQLMYTLEASEADGLAPRPSTPAASPSGR